MAAPAGGSIPAGAGKPLRPRPTRPGARVDPRGCGEADGPFDFPVQIQGRSLRVRGSHFLSADALLVGGSIPAGAGKPLCHTRFRRLLAVDPRGCGEARLGEKSADLMAGRSPRVRGSRQSNQLQQLPRGSIPAGAGKPTTDRQRPPLHRVDPRGCGEAVYAGQQCRCAEGRSPRVRGSQSANRGQVDHVMGRSPRVRGSRQPRCDLRLIVGSIPAGAGKPASPACRCSPSGVDPRGCGEAFRFYVGDFLRHGRSPRVRGSHPVLGGSRLHVGSIPAGAGKPQKRPCRTWRERVDPRGCGEASASQTADLIHLSKNQHPPRSRPSPQAPVGRGARRRDRPPSSAARPGFGGPSRQRPTSRRST